jgi:hypothetical protein
MATVRELLDERTQQLSQLLDQIRQETEGGIDLQRLTELSDELGARADDFAQTLSTAREALQGGPDEAEEGEEPAEDGGEEDEEGGSSRSPSAEGDGEPGQEDMTGDEGKEAE